MECDPPALADVKSRCHSPNDAVDCLLCGPNDRALALPDAPPQYIDARCQYMHARGHVVHGVCSIGPAPRSPGHVIQRVLHRCVPLHRIAARVPSPRSVQRARRVYTAGVRDGTRVLMHAHGRARGGGGADRRGRAVVRPLD